MRTCAIMQPTYLPWLGYFDLIRNVDVFVIYDHVQFEKRSWQQRNKLRDSEKELILSVPVITKSKFFQPINEVQIDRTQKGISKHLKTVQSLYSKSINYDKVFDRLQAIYEINHRFLCELNCDIIRFGMDFLGIKTPMFFSSNLNVQGSNVELLIDICKEVGATTYLSPVGSRSYIDENNLFPKADINLCYQSFDHPVYKQMNYPNFISHLSFIDYLFNATEEETREFGLKKAYK